MSDDERNVTLSLVDRARVTAALFSAHDQLVEDASEDFNEESAPDLLGEAVALRRLIDKVNA